MTTENYKSIVKKLKFEGRAFINGKYVDAIDGKKFDNINPATGEKLCSFGGYKQSGSLSRDQGTEALNQYLQTKTIWISHS